MNLDAPTQNSTQPLRSRALWNRASNEVTLAAIASDEVLAQLLDRGELPVWRWLYAQAQADPALAGRMARIVATVPLATGYFWAAALGNLGHQVAVAAGEL